MDWSKTALGPAETWPQSLRSTGEHAAPVQGANRRVLGTAVHGALQRRVPPGLRRQTSLCARPPGTGGMERDLGQHAPRAARRRGAHRRSVLGEGPAVRARTPRLSGRDLLRRLVRSRARRVWRGWRRVLHRDGNHRTCGGRTATGPAEGSGGNETPPRAPLAMPACSPPRHSPPGRRISSSPSRTWTMQLQCGTPGAEEQLQKAPRRAG